MVYTWPGGKDFFSWYSIGTLESDTYQRAECCLYAGFFVVTFVLFVSSLGLWIVRNGHFSSDDDDGDDDDKNDNDK